MNYPSEFVSLVNKVSSLASDDLQFIGQGNPNSKILLIGKDCNIDLSTTRGKGCYEMEYLHNAAQWKRNIDSGIEPSDVIDWVATLAIGEDKYNPLYPYRGLQNIKAVRTEDGESFNGGASASWCAYQSLVEKICDDSFKSSVIDFHQMSFLTVLSSLPSPDKGYNEDVENCVKTRCSKLFVSPFFLSFPVTILACGRFTKDYHIDIETLFNQKYIGIIENGNDWMRIYENKGRLLIQTRHITLCSDDWLEKIAMKAQKYLVEPLLKYCLYYDGSDDSWKNSQWGDYERHWIYGYIRSNNQYLQWDVQYMIIRGISEEWIDSFGIPRSLVGLFYNRYDHWVGIYDIKDFMNWFEEIRKGKVLMK